MRRLLAIIPVVIACAAGCAGFSATGPPAQYTTLTGTVQDIIEAMNWNVVQRTWSAQLIVSPDYNGSPNVNIGNDGNSECMFRDFIHNGDQLTITVQTGDSLNKLDASDVTVNGTRLDSYSGNC